MNSKPVAIVDIGSNSVRLVVYSGPRRIPSIIFNEKVMAGLGKGLVKTGELPLDAQERALGALRRFRRLVTQMDAGRVRVVATAAVRDASNGAEFLKKVRAAGFSPQVLSGEDEGIMAGLGVISAIPDADGIVGDLGGGSLELVDVAGGEVRRSASLPFGVLRLGGLLEKGEGAFVRKVARALAETGFAKAGRGRPFYMVGGSWRALARLDMLLSGHPLPITHEHPIDPAVLPELDKALATTDKADLKELTALSSSRLPTLPGASLLLQALAAELKPSGLIASGFGIREGLLYEALPKDVRALDPLIEAARHAGQGLGRFPEHGSLLDRWISGVFADDPPELVRLRCAACLLSDVAWHAHPDFRAERGLEMGLHGNWVAIDAPGRVMLAQALFANFGGGRDFRDMDVADLCDRDLLKRAEQWGLAMRLGQRLSGGVAAPLERSRLMVRGDMLRLEVRKGEESLFGEAVERRLKTLASSLGRGAEAVAV